MSMDLLLVIVAIAALKRDFDVHAALAPNEFRFGTQLRYPLVKAPKGYVFRPLDNPQKKRYRHLSCPAAAINFYQPICAWEPVSQAQRTFANECEMHRVSRLTSTQWISIRNGACKKNWLEKMKRSSYRARKGGKVRKAIPCPKVYNPVCAMLRGVKSTFLNECLVNAENINTGSDWEIFSSGICAEDYELRDEIKKSHSISKRSVTNAYGLDFPADSVESQPGDASITYSTEFLQEGLKLKHAHNNDEGPEMSYKDYWKQNNPFGNLPYEDEIDKLPIAKEHREIVKEFHWGVPMIHFSNDYIHEGYKLRHALLHQGTVASASSVNHFQLLNKNFKPHRAGEVAHKTHDNSDYEQYKPSDPSESPTQDVLDDADKLNNEINGQRHLESRPKTSDHSVRAEAYSDQKEDFSDYPPIHKSTNDPHIDYSTESGSQAYDDTLETKDFFHKKEDFREKVPAHSSESKSLELDKVDKTSYPIHESKDQEPMDYATASITPAYDETVRTKDFFYHKINSNDYKDNGPLQSPELQNKKLDDTDKYSHPIQKSDNEDAEYYTAQSRLQAYDDNEEPKDFFHKKEDFREKGPAHSSESRSQELNKADKADYPIHESKDQEPIDYATPSKPRAYDDTEGTKDFFYHKIYSNDYRDKGPEPQKLDDADKNSHPIQNSNNENGMDYTTQPRLQAYDDTEEPKDFFNKKEDFRESSSQELDKDDEANYPIHESKDQEPMEYDDTQGTKDFFYHKIYSNDYKGNGPLQSPESQPQKLDDADKYSHPIQKSNNKNGMDYTTQPRLQAYDDTEEPKDFFHKKEDFREKVPAHSSESKSLELDKSNYPIHESKDQEPMVHDDPEGTKDFFYPNIYSNDFKGNGPLQPSELQPQKLDDADKYSHHIQKSNNEDGVDYATQSKHQAHGDNEITKGFSLHKEEYKENEHMQWSESRLQELHDAYRKTYPINEIDQEGPQTYSDTERSDELSREGYYRDYENALESSSQTNEVSNDYEGLQLSYASEPMDQTYNQPERFDIFAHSMYMQNEENSCVQKRQIKTEIPNNSDDKTEREPLIIITTKGNDPKRQIEANAKSKQLNFKVPMTKILISQTGRLQVKPKIEYKSGEAIITFTKPFQMVNSDNSKDIVHSEEPQSERRELTAGEPVLEYSNNYNADKENQTTASSHTFKGPVEAESVLDDCEFGNDEVCGGSGGKYTTFANICDLMLRNIFLQTKWSVLHSGDCHNCSRHCGKEYDPMCANRNRINLTFANECHMNEAICKDKKSEWRILGKVECLNLVAREKKTAESTSERLPEKSRRQAITAAAAAGETVSSDNPTTTSSWFPFEFTLPRMLRIKKRTTTTTMQPPTTTTPTKGHRFNVKSTKIPDVDPGPNVMSLIRPFYFPWLHFRNRTRTAANTAR